MTSLTAMLLACGFTFLLTTLPLRIYQVLETYISMEAIDNGDLQTLQNLVTAWAVCNLVWYTNFGINFFVYVLSGPRFRQELILMLKLCLRHNKVSEQAVVVDAANTMSTENYRKQQTNGTELS